MSTIATPLSAEELRIIRSNEPTLSNVGGGVDLGDKINDLAAQALVDLGVLEAVAGTADLEGAIRVARGTILTAAVATLFTTPVQVIAAPGAGLYIDVIDCHWWLDFASVAYDAAAAGDTLGLVYTDANGAETVDVVAGNAIGAAAADYHALVRAVPELIPVANAAVFASLNGGEWFGAAGNSPLKYEIRYRVRTLDFAVS